MDYNAPHMSTDMNCMNEAILQLRGRRENVKIDHRLNDWQKGKHSRKGKGSSRHKITIHIFRNNILTSEEQSSAVVDTSLSGYNRDG